MVENKKNSGDFSGLCGVRHVLGVDIGGTAIKAAIVAKDGEVQESHQAETCDDGQLSADAIVSRVVAVIQKLVGSSSDIVISAIGVGVPGAVSESDGVITALPNLAVLNGYPLRNKIESEFHLPVAIDNSANNAARGEYLFGAAAGQHDFVLITMGTGVGGGLFVDGKLCGGAINYAGEIGHMKLVPDGRRCGCGGYGCWEAYGSATALVGHAKSLMENGCRSSLEQFLPGSLDAKVIVEAAVQGDIVANNAFNDLCRFTALGLANLINVLNPALCVISGGLSESGEFLLSKLRHKTEAYTLPRAWGAVRIILGELGAQSGQLGAAGLALSELGLTSDRGVQHESRPA